MRRLRFVFVLLALLATLASAVPARAQNTDATTTYLRQHPEVLGLPGFVLDQETNRNRIMIRQFERSVDPNPEANRPQPPLIQYRDRQQRPTDERNFIRDVQQQDSHNLP